MNSRAEPSLRESVSQRFNPPKGPVRLLCDEIGFHFDKRLERPDVLVAFVAELVFEIRDKHEMQSTLAERFGGAEPSAGSNEVLGLTDEMLASAPADLVARAAAVHDACHRLNPDDAYPTDHLIDMLSSCASAIRFGLEAPCHSRHAAQAASHVWKQLYGVSRFDRYTSAWTHDWACRKLSEAIYGLMVPALAYESNRKDGSAPQNSAEPLSKDPADG